MDDFDENEDYTIPADKPIKMFWEKPGKPMVHSVDPEGFLAVYAKVYYQYELAECVLYAPKQDPIDWDAEICLDDQYRIHLGSWPHMTKDPKDSIIFESQDPEWINYCTQKLQFQVPDYLIEHKNKKIDEW